MLTHIENEGKEYSKINLVMSTIPIKTTTMKSSKTDIWQAFLSDEIISSFEIRTIIAIRQNLLYFYWQIDSSVQPKHIVIGLVHTRVSLIKSNQYQSYTLFVDMSWPNQIYCKWTMSTHVFLQIWMSTEFSFPVSHHTRIRNIWRMLMSTKTIYLGSNKNCFTFTKSRYEIFLYWYISSVKYVIVRLFMTNSNYYQNPKCSLYYYLRYKWHK